MKNVFIDLETVGSRDFPLKAQFGKKPAGLANYAKNGDILLLCFAVDSGPPLTVVNENLFPYDEKRSKKNIDRLNHVLKYNECRVYAHNAPFDINMLRLSKNGFLKRFGYKSLNLNHKFFDTASVSTAFGGPASLADACKHWGVTKGKMPEGKELFKLFANYVVRLKSGGLGVDYRRVLEKYGDDKDFRLTDMEDGTWFIQADSSFEKYVEYCKRDVESTRALAGKLHKFFDRYKQPKFILGSITLTEKSNRLGVKFDADLSKRLQDVADKAKKSVKDIFKNSSYSKNFSKVENFNSDTQMRKAFNSTGHIFLESMAVDVVGKVMDQMEDHELVGLLENYKASKSSSFSKLKTGDIQSHKGCLYNMLRSFNTTTGRWKSQGFQLHNLPRNVVSNADGFKMLKKCEKSGIVQPRELKSMTGLLRPCLKPRSGKRFFIADLKQIEPRISFFLTGETKSLDAMKAGKDIYKLFAADAFQTLVKKVTKDQRQTSKACFLSMIYGGNAYTIYKQIHDDNSKRKFAGLPYDDITKDKINVYEQVLKKAKLKWKSFDVKYGYLEFSFKKSCGQPFFQLPLITGRSLFLWHPQSSYKRRVDRGFYSGIHLSYVDSYGVRQSIWGSKLFNYLIQATARDLFDIKMLDMYRLYGAVPVFHVHDEVIYEIKPSEYKLYEKRWKNAGNKFFKKIGVDFVESDCRMEKEYKKED